MKKILCTFLAAALLFCSLSLAGLSTYAADSVSGKWGNLDWTLDSSGTLTISGQGTMNGFNALSSDAWLAYSFPIRKVVIADGVTSIGDYAFDDCSALTEINIPDSVTSIGEWAFWGCTALAEINIPDSVTSIGDYAFDDCTALTEISIPDSVTSIGGFAFSGCKALTDINIPDSVAYIGYGAFDGCTALTEITIPDSVTYIAGVAFRACEALKLIFIKSSDIASELANYYYARNLISYAETVILGPKCTATGYIKQNFPYSGTATIGGETCTWYRKTEECAVHYYEDGSDACAICGEKLELGDINGDGVVDNADAALALRYDAGLTSLTDAQYTAADVNGDEIVDNADAALMLRLDAGLINKF